MDIDDDEEDMCGVTLMAVKRTSLVLVYRVGIKSPSHRPGIYRLASLIRGSICEHTGSVNESQILKGVRNGDLFGMCQVDISVPEQRSDEFKGRSHMSPQEYF
jgi:hypothetical protein